MRRNILVSAIILAALVPGLADSSRANSTALEPHERSLEPTGATDKSAPSDTFVPFPIHRLPSGGSSKPTPKPFLLGDRSRVVQEKPPVQRPPLGAKESEKSAPRVPSSGSSVSASATQQSGPPGAPATASAPSRRTPPTPSGVQTPWVLTGVGTTTVLLGIVCVFAAVFILALQIFQRGNKRHLEALRLKGQGLARSAASNRNDDDGPDLLGIGKRTPIAVPISTGPPSALTGDDEPQLVLPGVFGADTDLGKVKYIRAPR